MPKLWAGRRPPHVDVGAIPYFVSTRTSKSERIFTARSALIAVEQLRKEREAYGFLLLAFVFMPDHAHFVVVPAEAFNISQTMRIIKGGIARRLNAELNRTGQLWQEGFFDRVPRSRDDLSALIQYTEDNPVRGGLASDTASYAYSSADGSCTEDYQRYMFENDGANPARAKSPRYELSARRLDEASSRDEVSAAGEKDAGDND